jgi:hypothetical protein
MQGKNTKQKLPTFQFPPLSPLSPLHLPSLLSHPSLLHTPLHINTTHPHTLTRMRTHAPCTPLEERTLQEARTPRRAYKHRATKEPESLSMRGPRTGFWTPHLNAPNLGSRSGMRLLRLMCSTSCTRPGHPPPRDPPLSRGLSAPRSKKKLQIQHGTRPRIASLPPREQT